MKFLKAILGNSWKTTGLGLVALMLGTWSFWVHWVPYQSVYFNVVYVEIAPIGLLIIGWALIHARDHSCK